MLRASVPAVAVVLVLSGCAADEPGPVNPSIMPQQVTYGGCPSDAAAACNVYHPGMGTTPSNFSLYEGCFQMNRGEELRVVAADEIGPFPKTWFVWHEGTLNPAGSSPCILTPQGNKTRVQIPDGLVRCQAALTTAEHRYFEHFASNEVNGCLAWLECKLY